MTNTQLTKPVPATQNTTPDPTTTSTSRDVLSVVNDRATRWLSQHSITLLRISLGVVFLAFGSLKFFPGVSPAETMAQDTLTTLTFGVLSPEAALLLTAVTETFIGLTMITGRFLRTGVAVLLMALVGIMSPLVLFFGDLFPAPLRTPTLEGQYVLKDLILVCSALVVAARVQGARLVHHTPPTEQ